MSFPTDLSFRGESEVWNFWQPKYVAVGTGPGGEENMKIAQIAPLMESVPPRLYGGSERVASYVTEELVAQGHDVTLFASGQSITAAKLVPCCAQPLRLNSSVKDVIPYYMLMLD